MTWVWSRDNVVTDKGSGKGIDKDAWNFIALYCQGIMLLKDRASLEVGVPSVVWIVANLVTSMQHVLHVQLNVVVVQSLFIRHRLQHSRKAKQSGPRPYKDIPSVRDWLTLGSTLHDAPSSDS